MSTVTITAAEVNDLRQKTGAGMMDCKKALQEANGDFEAAIDYLRKKGQKVAANRSDKDALEGIVIANTTPDHKTGVIIALNCETDFVAKNQEFIGFTESILNTALANKPATIGALKEMQIDGRSINDLITDQIGKIGEKLELSEYELVEAPFVVVYNHPGYKLASMIGMSNKNAGNTAEVGRDIAMQVAAMAPVAIDKDGVDAETLKRELDIAKEQAAQEGKPAEMLEKIAMGKLNKFFKESTLLSQSFIKDDKRTISQLLTDTDKELKVTAMKRLKIGK